MVTKVTRQRAVSVTMITLIVAAATALLGSAVQKARTAASRSGDL